MEDDQVLLLNGSGILVDQSPRPLVAWPVDRPEWTTFKEEGFLMSEVPINTPWTYMAPRS